MLPENGQYMDFDVFLCRISVLKFLRLFKVILTSYDAARRQKRRQFMYDFTNIIKISNMCYLKMDNIWIPMFSYVENPFLRFLRLFEAFFMSYGTTQRKNRILWPVHAFELMSTIISNFTVCILSF